MSSADEIPHEVKIGVMGPMVLYSCVGCGSPLTSALDEAGGKDVCPDCGRIFLVPGVEYRAKAETARQNSEALRVAIVEDRQQSRKEAVVRRTARNSTRAQSLQLDRDPFKEWLIYSIVIAALLAFFGWRHLSVAVSSDDSGITLVILGLFGVGLGINLLGILRLRSEYVCAAVCIQKLRSANGFAELMSDDVAGIFHQHLKDLTTIAKYDSNFTQDSLVTLLYSRMMARSKMVEILAGVLVSLGLIGTVVGLISMTSGLSSSLEALGAEGNAATLMTGLRATMAGLGTAFYTTLVGAILGSVVLRILNNIYTSNVDHLISYVASTAEVTIVPRLKRSARPKGVTANAVTQ